MKKLNIGIVGLGKRGTDLLNTILKMDDINVVAVCDEYEDRVRDEVPTYSLQTLPEKIELKI